MTEQARDTEALIRDQIAKHAVLLYMKGTPQFPQCGFSARAVEALSQIGRPFAYVNILENQDIRAKSAPPPDRSMRAARFHGGATGLRLEDVPWPVAGPGEVVVRVAACGICGSDVHFLEGMPVPAPLPLTLGHEPAGVVEAVGANVTGWKPGDRVAIHLGVGCGSCATCKGGSPSACRAQRSPGLHLDGAFAEAIRIPASNLVRVPDGVSLAAAALATDCVTSPYHALACRGRLVAGERVVVIGVGGLGAMAVRLAKILGAGQVIAVDLSSVALERAAKLGADECMRIGSGRRSLAEAQVADAGRGRPRDRVRRPSRDGRGRRASAAPGRAARRGGRRNAAAPHRSSPGALLRRRAERLGSFASHIEDLADGAASRGGRAARHRGVDLAPAPARARRRGPRDAPHEVGRSAADRGGDGGVGERFPGAHRALSPPRDRQARADFRRNPPAPSPRSGPRSRG